MSPKPVSVALLESVPNRLVSSETFMLAVAITGAAAPTCRRPPRIFGSKA
jgi:hypothetical protein